MLAIVVDSGMGAEHDVGVVQKDLFYFLQVIQQQRESIQEMENERATSTSFEPLGPVRPGEMCLWNCELWAAIQPILQCFCIQLDGTEFLFLEIPKIDFTKTCTNQHR